MNLTNEMKNRDLENLGMFLRHENQFRFVMNSIGLIGSISMFVVYLQPNLQRLSVSVYFRFVTIFSALENYSYLSFDVRQNN